MEKYFSPQALNSNDKSGLHLKSYQLATGITQPVIWEWLSAGTSLQLLFDKDSAFKGQLFYGATISTKFETPFNYGLKKAI